MALEKWRLKPSVGLHKHMLSLTHMHVQIKKVLKMKNELESS